MRSASLVLTRIRNVLGSWWSSGDASEHPALPGWGVEIQRGRNMDLIALYHDSLPDHGAGVDDQTWQDLAMDEVFAKIDRTTSFLGRQVLYHQLRTYEDQASELAERARLHEVFRSDSAFRRKIQSQLVNLDGRAAPWLAPLLLKELPKEPHWRGLIFACSALSIAFLAGLYFHTAFLVPVVVLLLANVIINETYGRLVTPYLPGFFQLDRLLSACRALARIENPHGIPQLETIRSLAPVVIALRRRLGWLVIDRTRIGELGNAFFGYLNLFLLFDVVLFLRAVPILRQCKAEALTLLESLGSLDASISVASFMEGLPCVAVPILTEEPYIEVQGAYHPLLRNPVGNPLQLAGRSALITGSNMAGKTTFIRTIGINLILARTLHLCLAEQALLPRAVVHSSIRREDRLNQGGSYYFVELERLQEMIRAADSDQLHLFLIDEIFRGTNTIERIAASAAVLKFLGRKNLVLVTTHDLELQELLGEGFEMYHFSEKIVDGGCAFDYRIQSGPTRSRNAIRLLVNQGYPPVITDEAARLAEVVAAAFEKRNS